MERDNLHFNFRTIDGYQKPFNFVISEREAGKSTAFWLDKAYSYWKKSKRTTLVFRRLIADITDVYISDIAEVINKFLDPEDQVKLTYKQGAIKDGVINVFIGQDLFLRVVGLSIPLSRIKSLILRSMKFIVFDEFICNTRLGERYLKSEAFKFCEAFETFQRESPDLVCYFMGNPYSLYNPYFSHFAIPLDKLKRGTIYATGQAVVQCYEIKKELKEIIKARNPLYQFDNSYAKYAFDGLNINDQNIRLAELPQNYQLKNIIKMEEKFIAIWQNNDHEDFDKFFIGTIENPYSRKVFTFNFEDMVDKTIKLSVDDKFRFFSLKQAMEHRQVLYQTIEVYYLLEDAYKFF